MNLAWYPLKISPMRSPPDEEGRGDAKLKARAWQEDFNQQRPHSSLSYLTPQDFAIRCEVFATEQVPPPAPPALSLQFHNETSTLIIQPSLS